MTTYAKKALLLLSVLCTVQFVSAQTHNDALTAMQTENWDKAIEIYTAIAKANPTDQTALLTMGNAWLAKGDKEKAKANFEAAFNAKPEGPLAFIANGRVLLLQNNMAEADKQFAKAAKNGKKDVSALRQIGESYLYAAPGTKPNFTRAEELLKSAVDVGSKDVTTLLTLGYCYKEMPNGGLATQQYEIAESLDQKNPLTKFMLAKVYKAAKLPERFLIYCDKALAVAPNYTLALRAKAEHFYYSRRWEQATQAYKDLVAKGAEIKIEDEMQLANCLFISKDYKGCSELVEKIIKKDGSKNYLRRLLGYCYYETGEYQKGLDIMLDYFKKVTPEKEISSDYLYLGRLQVKTKSDTLVAISNLRKGAKMDSSQWAVYKEIAELYYTKKKNGEAAEAYLMYFDSVPKPEAGDLYKLGYVQYYNREDSLRYQKAEKTFSKVAEIAPKSTSGWLWAGKSAERLDPSPEAIAADPNLANQYGKALNYYEKYVEIAWTDKEKNKKDLPKVLQYISYCYFVKNDPAKFNDASAKWLEIESDPAKQQTVRDMQAAFGKDVPPPSTPVTTPINSGGGKG